MPPLETKCTITEVYMCIAAVCWVAFLGIPGVMAATAVDRKRLLEDLLVKKKYNADIRPVLTDSTTTLVTIDLDVHIVRNLHSREQYLETLAWLIISWTDEFLVWNETDYGGVEQFHIKSSKLWRPDIALYNSVDDSRSAIKVFSETNAVVSSNGSVAWLTSALLKSSCQLDVSNYPFDTQYCTLRFGSWTHVSSQVNVTCARPYAETDSHVRNGEWRIMPSPCVNHEVRFPCCPDYFSDATFTMVLERKPLFYIYNLLFPCICLLMTGALVFWVPPQTSEKASMAVTVLLAMTVFMRVIMDNVPPTSEVIPLLDKFFGATTGLLSMATMMTVSVINCHHRGNRGIPPPRWVRRYILGGLGKYVGRRRYQPGTPTPDGESGSSPRVTSRVNGRGDSTTSWREVLNARINVQLGMTRVVLDRLGRKSSARPHSGDGDKAVPKDKDTAKHTADQPSHTIESNCAAAGSGRELATSLVGETEAHVLVLRAILRTMQELKDEKDTKSIAQQEWDMAAEILDKIFRVTFLLITIISTLCIFI